MNLKSVRTIIPKLVKSRISFPSSFFSFMIDAIHPTVKSPLHSNIILLIASKVFSVSSFFLSLFSLERLFGLSTIIKAPFLPPTRFVCFISIFKISSSGISSFIFRIYKYIIFIKFFIINNY